jgi:hypothetical protein
MSTIKVIAAAIVRIVIYRPESLEFVNCLTQARCARRNTANCRNTAPASLVYVHRTALTPSRNGTKLSARFPFHVHSRRKVIVETAHAIAVPNAVSQVVASRTIGGLLTDRLAPLCLGVKAVPATHAISLPAVLRLFAV